MNQRQVGWVRLIAAAAVVLWVAACRRPSSSVATMVSDASPAPSVPHSSALTTTVDAAPPRVWKEVYYAGWTMTKWPPESIDWSGVSDVVLFGIVPEGDGVESASTNLGAERIAAATRVARVAGSNVLVSLGGERTGDRFRSSLAQGGATLAKAAAEFVAQHGLDGLVLDIEPLAEIPPDPLVRFVRSLRSELRPGARLEAVVAPDASEIARLNPVARELDRVGIMTYLRAIDPIEEQQLIERVDKPAEHVGVGPRLGRNGNVIVWHAASVCEKIGRPCRL